MKIFLVNGPNLNLLGNRETNIYGHQSLSEIEALLKKQFPKVEWECFQSNDEGTLLDVLQKAKDQARGVLLNPGAFGHQSIALRDCIAGIGIPVMEVHISNTQMREDFRKEHVLQEVCIGFVDALGVESYVAGAEILIENIRS